VTRSAWSIRPRLTSWWRAISGRIGRPPRRRRSSRRDGPGRAQVPGRVRSRAQAVDAQVGRERAREQRAAADAGRRCGRGEGAGREQGRNGGIEGQGSAGRHPFGGYESVEWHFSRAYRGLDATRRVRLSAKGGDGLAVGAAPAHQRGHDPRAEDQRDRRQRVLRADLAEQLPGGHLAADRDQQHRERGLEVVEPRDELRDEEEQRPQAEQRERVGGEDDERLGRDREDRGNRVDGEDHVDDGDREQRRAADGQRALAVLAHEQPAAGGLAPRDREAGAQLLDQLLLAVVVVAVPEHAPARVDQQRGEAERDPGEALERGGAGDDEHAAHDERAGDAVGQQLVALGLGDPEGAEDEQEDEDVVERERLLDEVAGRVVGGGRRLAHQRQHARERERDRHPHDRGERREAQAHLAAAPADEQQVDRQQHADGDDQGDPGGQGSGHGPGLRGVVDPRRFLRPGGPRGPGSTIWAEPC
jgi:hypothetical protein